MRWRKEGACLAISDSGYRVAMFRVGAQTLYRPSLKKDEFLSMPVSDPKEAQAVCERHQRVIG